MKESTTRSNSMIDCLGVLVLINVEVALYATLRRYNPHGESSDPFPMQLAAGSSIAHLLEILKIPPQESKQVFVDNVRREKNYVLQEGQRVAVFPPIAGG